MSQDNGQNPQPQGSFYNSIGIGGIVDNKRKINKVLRLASFSPDFLYEREQDKKGRIFFDRYKYLGSGFGVSVKGYRRLRANKEGQLVEKHTITDWGIFAQGYHDNQVENAFVDTDEDQFGFCLAEDAASTNLFEFRINNMMELLDKYKKMRSNAEVTAFEREIKHINMAMLMLYGTVLLPVEKCGNDNCECQQQADEQAYKELAARARRGDAEAEADFHQMVREQEMELSQRLAEEDLLSVFEGYFLNMVEQSGIFSILADILDVTELTNEATGEKLYRMTISVTDTQTTTYINQSDLLGMPMAGMRLMGIGMLQGDVRVT
ncbi:MAG: DUF3881 family protein [Defluviitaleaceae bacterium]|nr:DUF3881 family protein [Defluviitaleaceae bacterium]